MEYNFKEVEQKWQNYWKKTKQYKVRYRPVKTQILCIGYVSLPVRSRPSCRTSTGLHCFRYLFQV